MTAKACILRHNGQRLRAFCAVSAAREAQPSKNLTLLKLMQSKEYFVLTTNVDHCFQKEGFDKGRLYYTQGGGYGLWQCSIPCQQKTYDNKVIVKKMFAEQNNRKVPRKLVPDCPVCGVPMSMTPRLDKNFVEDEGWCAAARRKFKNERSVLTKT